MSKHTPGPWFVSKIDNDWCIHAENDSAVDYSIAYCQPSGWDDDGINHEVNAQLICAAPDLLDALRAVLPLVNAAHGHRYRKQVLAAIAKAEGNE